MKPIWRNHHLHHYKSDDKGFGVSSHFWDKVFGTGFNLKKEGLCLEKRSHNYAMHNKAER
jgi:sterol desaturase/sphingolipid hydroxylase (fatty acid hydroxylase superfamily)